MIPPSIIFYWNNTHSKENLEPNYFNIKTWKWDLINPFRNPAECLLKNKVYNINNISFVKNYVFNSYIKIYLVRMTVANFVL